MLFPLITLTRLDSALLLDLLALQKLQKLPFSTGLFSIACGLPDLPWQHLFLPPTSPTACSLSPQILETLPHCHGKRAGLFSAGGSPGDSQPSWLQGRGPSCLCWARGVGAFAGEVNPTSDPAGGQRCTARGNDDAQNVPILAKALHAHCRACTWLSEEQLGQVLVSTPAGPVQLQGPGRMLGIKQNLIMAIINFRSFLSAALQSRLRLC